MLFWNWFLDFFSAFSTNYSHYNMNIYTTDKHSTERLIQLFTPSFVWVTETPVIVTGRDWRMDILVTKTSTTWSEQAETKQNREKRLKTPATCFHSGSASESRQANTTWMINWNNTERTCGHTFNLPKWLGLNPRIHHHKNSHHTHRAQKNQWKQVTVTGRAYEISLIFSQVPLNLFFFFLFTFFSCFSFNG